MRRIHDGTGMGAVWQVIIFLGGVLPTALAVTGVAQIAFPAAANGSLIVRDGKAVGSDLIGQPFSDPKHFWSRPSATSPMPYNAANSAGSNQGPANPALADAVKGRLEALRAADPGNTAPVPVDLVTASASGLDPHISRAAADRITFPMGEGGTDQRGDLLPLFNSDAATDLD